VPAGSTAARRNRRISRARKTPHAGGESSADKSAHTGDPASRAAATSVEPEALSVTHWFESGTEGDPFAATVRFNGRRHGISGKPSAGDTFLKEEVIDPVVPGSGPVSVTTWVYGLNPGQWTVTAELIRGSSQIGRVRSGTRRGARGGGQSLPRAAWAWRRWKLSNGSFTPVSTRWAPLVRLGRMPAVIPGAWSGLVGLGVLVGVLVQAALLARYDIPLLSVLTVDLVAVLSGLLGAKLLYVALRPRSWRQSIGEGWSVDGFLVVMPIVALAALLAFGLPLGVFLDASAPALFFGVAIGRLGCFFTGCCAGRCTRSRWGVWSSDRRIGARRIPTQLLESAAGLLIGGASLLLALGDPPKFGGGVFLASLAAYVLARQLLLRLRAEPHNLLRAQLTAGLAILVLVGAAAALLFG
jgi:phosphatidylglycerol:prolipoprotein diacylglycerol transferase